MALGWDSCWIDLSLAVTQEMFSLIPEWARWEGTTGGHLVQPLLRPGLLDQVPQHRVQ